MTEEQRPEPWTWERLRQLVVELGLEPGTYAAGPTALLLMDGTLQQAPSMELLVTDELYRELSAQGWTDLGFALVSRRHPGLSASKVDASGSLGVSPAELIRLAEPVHGVQVPPRRLLVRGTAATRTNRAANRVTVPSGLDFLARHWRAIIWTAAVVGTLVVLLVIMNTAGGFQHLVGGTTKVRGEVVEVHEGGQTCDSKSDLDDEPYTIVYGWTVDGEQYTAERDKCRDERPEVGAPQDVWIDDDNELASTFSPMASRIGAGTIVGLLLVACAVGYYRSRRRRGRGRSSRPTPARTDSTSLGMSVPTERPHPTSGPTPPTTSSAHHAVPGVSSGTGRDLPEAWHTRPVPLFSQVAFLLLGGLIGFLGVRALGESPLGGAAIAALGIGLILLAQPWLWLPRSHQRITTGSVDGQLGQVIPQRPPSLLSTLGLLVIALLAIGGGIWYAVTTWGDEDSGGVGALFLGGGGGAALLWLASTRLTPAARENLDLLVTADGLGYKGHDGRTFLRWDQVSDVTATSIASLDRLTTKRRGPSGIGPQLNLIEVRGLHGSTVASWQCRYLQADPVEALELLQRMHRGPT